VVIINAVMTKILLQMKTITVTPVAAMATLKRLLQLLHPYNLTSLSLKPDTSNLANELASNMIGPRV